MKNSRLKPVFGMRPGLFLLMLLVAIVLLLLFLFLFLPGILHNGTLVTIESSPERSAVYIDDVYRGASPITLFIDKGDHDVTIEKQHFRTFRKNLNVRGRVFGTLFSKRKKTVEAVMDIEDLDGYLNDRLEQLYSLSLIREYSSSYRYPSPAKEILHDLEHQPEVFTAESWKHFVSFFPLLASSEMIIDDMLVLLSSEAVSEAYPSSRETAQELTEQKLLIQGRSQKLPRETDDPPVFAESSRTSVYSADLHMLFEYIPAGSFVYGNDAFTAGDPLYAFPHRLDTREFYILDTPVTWGMFSSFLEENPEWQLNAAAELKEKGYADDFYLAGSSKSITEPAAYISYYAAEAFCSWLSRKIQNILPGWTAVLPTSVQWEQAYDYAEMQKKNMGFLMTNWEWTSSVYYPASSLSAFLYDKSLYPFSIDTDMCLKGGSPVSRKNLISSYTNGAADPVTCSPVIGFRPVLIPE